MEIKKIWVGMIQAALTFALIFNISFNSIPSITTGRVAIFVLVICYGSRASRTLAKFIRTNISLCISLSVMFVSTILWLVANNNMSDREMLSRVIWFAVLAIAGAALYMEMCRGDLRTAMRTFFFAILAQSIFVFVSVISPGFRAWVESAIVNVGNIQFSDVTRFSGLSSGGGALLSLQLALGVISVVVLQLISGDRRIELAYFLGALIIAGSTVFVGRTGLYVSASALVLFFVVGGFRMTAGILILGCFAVPLFVWVVNPVALMHAAADQGEMHTDQTFRWAFDYFYTGKSDSADALVDMFGDLPPISPVEFLIGTGRLENWDGSNFAHNDSGYIQNFYAVGFPLACWFYGALFWVVGKRALALRGTSRVIMFYFLVLLIVLEFKEPFIFKYTLPFVVFCVLLARNDESLPKSVRRRLRVNRRFNPQSLSEDSATFDLWRGRFESEISTKG